MVHLAMRMYCNWPTDHAIDHSSIGLNRLTIQLVFNEVSLFTFSKGTHGFDVTVPKNYLKEFSVRIKEEELTAAKKAMSFMNHVSKSVAPLRKPVGYPSYSDVEDPENVEPVMKHAQAPPTAPTIDALTEYIPDVLRRMYHFRKTKEKEKFDSHKAYLDQACFQLQELLRWESPGEPDQTDEGTERAHWVKHY